MQESAEKTHVSDRYDRVIDYLRISITDRCNLRCIYCMPSQGALLLPHSDILTYEEILRTVRVAAGLGVRKIRITGGEPLVRKNLPWLIASLKTIPGIEDISLTTNGILLAEMIDELASAGLTRINISIDSLKPDRYAEITRGGDLAKVIAGVERAGQLGVHPIKINMVPIRGLNDDEILTFAALTMRERYDVRFIEFMPTGANYYWSPERVVATDEIMQRVQELGVLSPVRHRKDGPARYFSLEGSLGVLGFISPISHHFCSSCNRLRLTSDGKLRPCLFSETEIDLKSAMRRGAPDSEIERLLRLAVEVKPQAHTLNSSPIVVDRRPMSAIGG
jgi:cyclic pyranopterin phosphate synthase